MHNPVPERGIQSVVTIKSLVMQIVVGSRIYPPENFMAKKPFWICFKPKMSKNIDDKHMKYKKKNDKRMYGNGEHN